MNDLQNFKSVLEKIAHVPDEEWDFFVTLLKKKSLRKGEIFFSFGDENLHLGFVIKGLLHSYYHSANGKVFSKSFIWETRMAGAWTSILQNKSAQFECVALEDSDLIIISAKDFLNLPNRHVCWLKLMKSYTEKLLIEREDREYNVHMLDNHTQYMEFKKNFQHIFGRLPQYLIASYIGITEVSLSRMLKNSKN